ncbi:MAG: hypothetical protein HOV68_00360 [Streptomycetaceae bacterium]|nr:hypothetical protein [Streptomycetaceae bacterium]
MKLRRICTAAVLAVAGLAVAVPSASAAVDVQRDTESHVVVGDITVHHEEHTSVHVG